MLQSVLSTAVFVFTVNSNQIGVDMQLTVRHQQREVPHGH